MNISDWQHKENLKELATQHAKGYKITVTADGYSVWLGALFIAGASVKLPREKPLHWKHAAADRRDHLNSALSCIRAYEHKTVKFTERN